MMTVLLTAFFFGTLAFFGAMLGMLLRVRDAFGLFAFTLCGGSAVYIVLSNVLGYLLPIRLSFTLTLVMLLVCGIAGAIWMWRKSSDATRIPFEIPPRKILAIVFLVFVLAGLAYARDRGSDEWVPTHFVFPASILEGNFPIRDTDFPWERTSYHYGYTLLVAGITHATGLTLSHAHTFLPVIAAAGILFFAGAIAWRLRRSWGAASLAAVLTLGGAGLFWLYLVPFAADLYDSLVQGVTVSPSPFRWLTPAIRAVHAEPLLMVLGHRAIALGGAYLFGVLYCLQNAWEQLSFRKASPWILTAIVFGAALANTMETTLVLLFVAIGIFVLALLFVDRRRAARAIVGAAAFAIPVILIAVTQGGPLTEMHGNTGAEAFTWNLTGRIFHDANIEQDSIPLWDLRFWRDYGFHLVLLIAAIVYVWKRRTTMSFGLLIAILALLHFSVPVVLFYTPFPGQLLRFFYVYFSLGSLVIALYVWDAFLMHPRRRLVGIGIVTTLLIAATLHVGVRLAFPSLRLEATEFFPSMPPVTAAQEEMHRWVKHSTVLDDYFFIATLREGIDFRTMEKDRLTFAFSTGRFALGFGNHSSPSPDVTAHLHAINDDCDDVALDALRVTYIVVPTERQADWFKNECDAARWKPVYTGGSQYPNVYARIGR